MRRTLSEIAEATGLAFAGNPDIVLGGAAEPAAAGPEDLAMAMTPDFSSQLAQGQARAAVLAESADWQALGLEGALFAPRPRVALAGVTTVFAHAPDVAPGVHQTALIDGTAVIGGGSSVGAYVTVGPGVRIGPGARILAHATIGAGAEIGADALIAEGVRIGARVTAGNRLIVHANAVIGADGFSFVTPERGSVEAAKADGALTSTNTGFRRIHSLGAVTIGDDVEIGAGTTIDRGTLTDTAIGSGTKIDNLVQVGHNVRIGETCLICAQVGIAGSTVIGDRVVLGGKVGIADHVRIGANVVVAAASNVGTNIPSGRIVMGTPAIPRDEWVAVNSAVRRLPRSLARIREKLGL